MKEIVLAILVALLALSAISTGNDNNAEIAVDVLNEEGWCTIRLPAEIATTNRRGVNW